MEKTEKFAVVGGDLRQISVANALARKNYAVSAYGFSKTEAFDGKVALPTSLEDCLRGAGTVVLPLPCSSDDKTVNTVGFEKGIALKELFLLAPSGAAVYGGRISESVRRQAEEAGLSPFDYFACEEVEILNAVPTAEGAVQIAMEETLITLHGAQAMVIGYGRIGKILSRYLRALGAEVTVLARKERDLAWIQANGLKGAHVSKLASLLERQDVIFNTAPARLVGERELQCMRDDAVFIDLASKPGGVDFEAARMAGKKVIWALSLPGKVAPITAGRIIADTILRMKEQKGGV